MTQMTARSRIRMAVVAGILLVLIVLAVGYLLLSRGGPPRESVATATTSSSSDAGGSPPAASDGEGEEGATGTPAQPTAVEPPEPGGTEPIAKPPSTEIAAFDESVGVSDDLVVTVVSVEAAEAGRDIPGERSGPAVKVVIAVENHGDQAVDTSGASVNLTYGDDDLVPAPQVLDDASSVLAPTVPPGGSAQGTYLFAVPLENAGNVRIMVDVLASEPDVVFSGPRP